MRCRLLLCWNCIRYVCMNNGMLGLDLWRVRLLVDSLVLHFFGELVERIFEFIVRCGDVDVLKWRCC